MKDAHVMVEIPDPDCYQNVIIRSFAWDHQICPLKE